MSRRRSRPLRSPASDDRPVLDRVAAMIAERSYDRAHRRFGIIRQSVVDAADIGPWLAAVFTLLSRGTLDEDETAYLLGLFTEPVVEWGSTNDAELVALHERIEEVRKQHGLTEDDDWLLDEMPPERRALEDQWSRRADQLQADAMRRAGGERFADLLEHEPEDFEAQAAAGLTTFWSRWPDRDED
jgi:hypothetical protein